jgi:hypothetical protein
MNQSEKVKNMAGMVYLTLRGFLLFYEGNFDQAISNFNKSVDKNTEEEGHSAWLIAFMNWKNMNWQELVLSVSLTSSLIMLKL